MGKRDYTEATKSALFALSTKCYFPDCGQPTVTFFEESPEKKVQIAHIHAVERNGPRWLPGVDTDAFSNLILLCTFHHRKVDKKTNEDAFPADLLREWKKSAESAVRTKVDGLDRLTEPRLQAMLQESAQTTKSELEAAIGLVQQLSEGAAEILRAALDRLNAHYLDTDAIGTLEAAAYSLRGLEENATTLASAAKKLEGLEGNVNTLEKASTKLSNLEENGAALVNAADSVSTALQTRPDLSGILDSIHEAGEQVSYNIQAAASTSGHHVVVVKDPHRWKYFSAGIVVAAVLVVAGLVIGSHLAR